MVLSAEHLNVILLSAVLPTMCIITNRQHGNIFKGRSEGQPFFEEMFNNVERRE